MSFYPIFAEYVKGVVGFIVAYLFVFFKTTQPTSRCIEKVSSLKKSKLQHHLFLNSLLMSPLTRHFPPPMIPPVLRWCCGGVVSCRRSPLLSSPLLSESPRCSYASRLSRQQRQQCVVVISPPRTELAFCVAVPPGEGRQTAARQGIPVTIRTVQAATSRRGQ